MKNFKFINLLIFIFLAGAVQAESTVFAFGKYDTKTDQEKYGRFEKLNKILSVPDANELEVTIVGRIEDKCEKRICDTLKIYDSQGKRIETFTGKLNERFSVVGSSIKVSFYSDGRKEYEGAIVRIKARSLKHIFDELKEKLLKSVDMILKYGADEIHRKIDKHYKIFNILYNTLSNDGDVEKFIEEILQRLGETAQIYREISNLREDIVKVHTDEFEKIKYLKTKVLSNRQQIYEKGEKYLSLLDKSKQAFDDIDDPREKKKLELSVVGYKNIIQNIQIQKTILDNFDTVLNTLDDTLRKHSEKILMLLYMLGINAEIYEQASNIPVFNQKFTGDLSHLNDLSELKQLVSEIEKSEYEIQQQLEKIQKTDFE